jgi:hypothetical protein
MLPAAVQVQRGTSRGEDLLDSVLTLKHPSNYSASDGLRCEVVFEKSRSFFGPDARPFELQMSLGAAGESVVVVSMYQDTDHLIFKPPGADR